LHPLDGRCYDLASLVSFGFAKLDAFDSLICFQARLSNRSLHDNPREVPASVIRLDGLGDFLFQ
jgi:hypothetical protein